MRRAALAALACAPILVATAPAEAQTLSPTVVLEGDYRLYSHENEGFDGFAFSRLQLGAHGELGNTFYAAVLVDFVEEETPEVIDAYLNWKARPDLVLSGGYIRSPLFPSARDEYVERLAIPELSTVVGALWPGRSVGLAAHYSPEFLPIEAWARVGNGAPDSLVTNDTDTPSADLRVDFVLGRPHAGMKRDFPWGLRVGIGGHVDRVDTRHGVTGTTASGYEFYLPATVSGNREVIEAHLLAQYESLQLDVEGGFAQEGRAKTVSGDPSTPREVLTAVQSDGISAELAWMITGDHRVAGTWPMQANDDHGAVEVAARFESLALGRCAQATTECTTAVQAMDATVESAAVRWWFTPWAGASLAGYHYGYSADPFNQPGVRQSWLGLARLTLSLR